MSTTIKIYTLQPQLDVPVQSRIRFPLWLKCLYNVAQMELTTLDPLGAFFLVALDADWAVRSFNVNSDGSIRPRPTFGMPLPLTPKLDESAHTLLPAKSLINNNESKQIYTLPSAAV
jgi:hypothetical protein